MRPYRNTTRIRLKYECSSSGLLGLLLSGRSEHSAPAAPRGPSGASAKLGDCTSIPYIGNSAKSPHGRGRPGQRGPPPATATVRPIPTTVLPAADRPLSGRVLGARCLRLPFYPVLASTYQHLQIPLCIVSTHCPFNLYTALH